MRHLVLLFIVYIFSISLAQAQVYALASTSTKYFATPDLSLLPHTTDNNKYRMRTRGTYGMIAGASLVLIGSAMVASAQASPVNGDSEGLGWGGIVLILDGSITFCISGVLFAVHRLSHKPHIGYRYTIYSKHNQVGIAYNF